MNVDHVTHTEADAGLFDRWSAAEADTDSPDLADVWEVRTTGRTCRACDGLGTNEHGEECATCYGIGEELE